MLVMLKFLNQDFNESHKGKRYVPYIYRKAIGPPHLREKKTDGDADDEGDDEKKNKAIPEPLLDDSFIQEQEEEDSFDSEMLLDDD